MNACRTRWRLMAIRQFTCCLMLALPILHAHAKSPDSMPPPAAEQKPAAANQPLMPTPGRGQMLYENHCISCHASVVHIRDQRKAISLEEIRKWTRHWALDMNLPWSDEEIDDVSRYLNAHYYKYEQP